MSLRKSDQRISVTDYLESEKTAAVRHEYVAGYVYAINGEINSAEVYASPELFRQMWPKLLRASATEAVAEKPKAKSKTPPTAADVKTALADADRANPSSKQTAGSSTVTRKESAKVVMFETHDSNQGSDWIHRIYVVK